MMRVTFQKLLLCSVLPLFTFVHAENRLSLIETSPVPGAGSGINRSLPFVELRYRAEPGAEDSQEYSVPFTALQLSEVVSGDLAYNWARYQDRMHWAMMTGLNTTLITIGNPVDLYNTNCLFQIPADIQISLVQGITGKGMLVSEPLTLDVSNPDRSQTVPVNFTHELADDHVSLDSLPVPRVPRGDYCPGNSPGVSDIPLVYLPGVMECLGPVCVNTPGYPKPTHINTEVLTERLRLACARMQATAYPEYQKDSLLSLARLPNAIHWDGVMTLHGNRSGTTLAPVLGLTNAPSVAAVVQKASTNPLLLPYLTIKGKTTQQGFLGGSLKSGVAPLLRSSG